MSPRYGCTCHRVGPGHYEWCARVRGEVAEMPDVMSVAEVAAMLNVSRMTVLRLIDTKQLRARRIHRWWQVEVAEVHRFIEDNRTDRGA